MAGSALRDRLTAGDADEGVAGRVLRIVVIVTGGLVVLLVA